MTLAHIRWGGAAAAFAGLSYGAAGYVDSPGASGYAYALVSVLSVTTPTLFLVGLVGLRSGLNLGARRSYAREAGFASGCLGTILGVAVGVTQGRTFLGPMEIGSWWWALLFVGLALMGLSAFQKEVQRLLAASVLVSSALGWVSLLADPAFPGVLVPMRPVHVAFAALFCLSCLVWGGVLYRVAPHGLTRPEP